MEALLRVDPYSGSIVSAAIAAGFLLLALRFWTTRTIFPKWVSNLSISFNRLNCIVA